jgi:hypothetical protein
MVACLIFVMPHTRIVTWVLAGLATLSLVSCSSGPSSETAQNRPLPAGVHQGTLKEAVSKLKVANEGDRSGYSRDKFGYPTKGSDGCNTRKKVLIAESATSPNVGQPGCKLKGGKWTSYFDQVTTTDPQKMSIDHTVPLAEAWRSGASEWSAQKRSRFANDVTYAPTLAAVTVESNNAKGDKDPASWMPQSKDATCFYAGSWIAVKLRYDLTADPSEVAALQGLKQCQSQTMQWKTS